MTNNNHRAKACAIIGDDDPLVTNSESHKLLLKSKLRELIESLISEYGCRDFISGMHRGTELLGAELIIEMKAEHKLSFWGIISSEEQWIDWTTLERERFFTLMEQADYEYRTSNRNTAESRSAQLKIIEEEADIFIVFKSKAGADLKKMLAKAVKNGKKVIVIDPITAESSSFLELV